MARNHLSDEQWKSIRTAWEYDPDEPTFNQAAGAASVKFGFVAPSKSTIDSRAKREGWERRGSLNGVNAAAQRKADKQSNPDGSAPTSDARSDASDAKKEQAGREEAEDKRAAVLVRHRQEWQQVALLRQEALNRRPKRDPVTGNPTGQGSVAEAFESAKLAKITAEMTMIQQQGERKAWGLDIVVDPDQLKNLSDADLEALAAGRAPGRR